ncbi:Allantoicase [Tulasnella sp. 332]|nr:Allantoicase [Tulasnella sp. 332]
MSPYTKISFEDFQTKLGSAGTEISSVSLGGKVISCSDEFFADASNLLKVEPALSMKGQFGPKGALFDGWESKRHNPTYDWVIIKLGAPGHIIGFDIDTANFNGNEAPQASVEALFSNGGDHPREKDDKWKEVLQRVDLGPSSRHLFKIEKTVDSYTHVKLNMYPDGGIARFRVYGIVAPAFPSTSEYLDLAHVLSGGRVVFTSDQHFGVGPNLLLPGRGKDMGDGWETKRSRVPGHKDWAIIRLGAPGYLQEVEIDTAHFKGNFPESCDLFATETSDDLPSEDAFWTPILARRKLQAHRQHVFELENSEQVHTHVRLTIYPDGGVKRVRVIGRRAEDPSTSPAIQNPAPTAVVQTPTQNSPTATTVNGSPHYVPISELAAVNGLSGAGTEPSTVGAPPKPTTTNEAQPPHSTAEGPITITAVALTHEVYAAYGDVIQAYSPTTSGPSQVGITSANQGSAHKFHRLSPIVSSYPPNVSSHAIPAISVFRSTPVGAKLGEDWPVRLLERHSHTSQAFVPMGTGGDLDTPHAGRLEKTGRAYLVIVAHNDDKPDLSSLRAFVATTAQGISYFQGIWQGIRISLLNAMARDTTTTPNNPSTATSQSVAPMSTSQTHAAPDTTTATTPTTTKPGQTPTTGKATPTAIDIQTSITSSQTASETLIPLASTNMNPIPIATPTLAGATASSGGISGGVKALIGVIVGLLVLAGAAAGAFYFLQKKWKVRGEGGAGVRRQWSLYEATSLDDHDVERDESGRDELKEGENLGLYDGVSALGPKASKTSKRSSRRSSSGLESPRSRYARIGRQRNSVGLDLEPEAYAMFGASAASLDRYNDDDDDHPQRRSPPGLGLSEKGDAFEMGQRKASPPAPFDPTDPKGKRRSADNGPGIGGAAGDTRARRLSVLDDASQYPSISSAGSTGSKRLSRSGSEPFDPFSDAVPAPTSAASVSPLSPPLPPPGAMQTNPFRK